MLLPVVYDYFAYAQPDGRRAVILYHRWKCPWCAAVRQAAENVGADLELVEVPYPREERTMVIAASGQPRVPVLVDDDEVLVESKRIVRHLYSRYGGHGFERSITELDADIAIEDEEHESSTIPGGDR
jgi:glutaredoxin 3